MAYYLDDNAIATIDTSIYNCIKIVYLRDTIVPNSAPVKIKGRSWNFGIGRHKETIATYVYLRKSDYLPVEVVELFPDKKVKVSTPSKRDVKTTWFLKNRIE